MRRRFSIHTTLYGPHLVTRAQLYQLHREVAKAASEARMDDPKYVENTAMGKLAARGR